MGGFTDMDVGVFLKTSVSVLKIIVLQLFQKYVECYVSLNVKSCPKFKGPLDGSVYRHQFRRDL